MVEICRVSEWAGEGNRLLKSTSTIKCVNYQGSEQISYSTFEKSGVEKLKLIGKPASVLVDGKAMSSYTWDDNTKVLVINRSKGSNVMVKID